MKKPLKLRQAQLWKVGGEFLRLVRVERLEVEFMTLASPDARRGEHNTLSKKDFCRLLKNGVLMTGPLEGDGLTD